MMNKVEYWKITYPKGYYPGMGYKKKYLGKTWFSSLRSSTIGLENAIWDCAARLKITCDVDTFQVTENGDNYPWFAGTL